MYLSTPGPSLFSPASPQVPFSPSSFTSSFATATSTATPPAIEDPRGPGGRPEDDPNNDLQNWSSLIGIITAIVGNILIALALNVQRYAHIRIHKRQLQARNRARQAMKNASNGRPHGPGEQAQGQEQGQEQERGDGTYGSTASMPANSRFSRDSHLRTNAQADEADEADEERDAHESDPLAQSFQSSDSRWSEDGDDNRVVSSYLKDPYWWLGQVLITVGEMGNFLAYGFAPASIVSPLGVVALVSNCVIAPILFKEVFRQRDFWGVLVAMAGAVTVVLSAKQRETKLAPHDVWDAITAVAFEVYLALTWMLIIFLMWASPRYGSKTILIDLGLVGLFGGYTALSTKGVSSMLSSTLFKAFTTPVTYALILILLSTAVMQVRYLNRALQRFDSTQVIPTQFVLFTLCVIVGSAILYRDFERTTGQQAAKFVGGCLLTFFGVFLITSGRPRNGEDDDLSDADGVEETIGLADHATQPNARTPLHPSRKGDKSGAPSRRSSAASRATIAESLSRPLGAVGSASIRSFRIPTASNSRASLAEDGQDASPLHDNPWLDSPSSRDHHQHHQHQQYDDYIDHPGIGSHTVSADSVFTIQTSPIDNSPVVGTPPAQIYQVPGATASQGDQPTTPATPRASSSRPHSKVMNAPMFSPSPFSSTVTAVVADKLLPSKNSKLRRIVSRRARVRNSTFAPQQDGADDEHEHEHEHEHEGMATTSPSHRAGRDFYDDDDDERWPGEEPPPRGLRGRARSLSNALGEILGVKKKRREDADRSDGEEQDDPLLSGTGGRPPLGSTETL